MARKLVREYFRHQNGQVAAGQPITIVGRGGSSAVAIYLSLVGATQAPNPFSADAQGGVSFYAEEGTYDFLVLGARVPFDVVGAAASEGYVHVQSTPAATWTMPHPLGRLPGVMVLDVANQAMITDLDFPDTTTVVATFALPTLGKAIFS